MIWSIVISLIPVFILVFIVLHSSGKREESSLRGYCDDFQDSLNLQNQRHENETLHSDDFETPTNRNLNFQSVFNQQDESIESTDLTSDEVSSTNPKRCYTNSQFVSNQKEDGKKVNAVPCSVILNRNPKVINRNESRLETIQPDEMRNNPLSSRAITNKNLIGSKPMITKSAFTPSSKNENEIFPSKDIHCWNLEECWSNIQLVTKQQDDGKEDKAHEFPDTLNKNSKKCCKVSELLSKQTGEEREHPFKDIHEKKIEVHLNNFQTVSRQHDYGKDNALQSKVNRNKNLEGSFSNNQIQSKQQKDGKENKSLVSKDVQNKNVGGYLNTSQTVSTPCNLEKDKSLQSKGILSKNLEVNCSNSQLSTQKHENRKEDQILPSKIIPTANIERERLEQDIPNLLKRSNSKTVSREQDHKTDTALQSKDIQNKNLEGSCSNSRLLSPQQGDGKEDKALPSKHIQKMNIEEHLITSQIFFAPQDDGKDKALQSKDIQNKNLRGSCLNPLSQSKQQDDGKEDKALSTKHIQKTSIEEHLITSQIFLAPQDDGKDKALQSKDIHNKNLQGNCPNPLSQSKQQDDGTEDKSVPSKDVHSKNIEECLDKNEKVSNQKGDGMEEKYLPSKRTQNRNPNRYFFNSELVSKQHKEKMRNRTFTSKIRDNPPKGVGSFMCVLFENQLYTDVTFVSKGNKALLSAHRAVLAAKCEYFKDLLFGDLAKESDGMQMDIEIKDVPFRIFSSIVNCTEFEKSPFNIVREICQLQCLSLKSEAELLEAILRWLNAQLKLKRNVVKELERALLKCVRFLSFGAKEFSDVVAKNATLLTAEESLNILLYLNNPTPDGLEALPKWCDKSQRTLLSNQKRKDSGIEKNLLSEDSEVGKIKIELKPPDVVQDFSELTSVLHMRCKKGMHQITSVKCSLQAAENSGCVLADLKIIVNVMPNGPKFLKFYSIKQREVTFDFPRAVPVHEGQVLMMEVTAYASPSCKFFQFYKWLNDPKSYFDCFFISKPREGRFYFISEVAYEPLAPRLNFPH